MYHIGVPLVWWLRPSPITHYHPAYWGRCWGWWLWRTGGDGGGGYGEREVTGVGGKVQRRCGVQKNCTLIYNWLSAIHPKDYPSLSSGVYVYVCVYMFVYMFVYMCVYVCIYVCVCVCMCVCICVCMCVCVCVCIFVCNEGTMTVSHAPTRVLHPLISNLCCDFKARHAITMIWDSSTFTSLNP